MEIAIVGLWHLGSVTAACLAAAKHQVQAYDDNPLTTAKLQEGKAPISEPGLNDLIADGLTSGQLLFSSDLPAVLKGSEIVWVTYDTPVNEDDVADIDWLLARIYAIFPYLTNGMTVLISSQIPVGTTAKIAQAFAKQQPGKDVGFAYAPENLRLGKAIQVFCQPDRVVVGTSRAEDRDKIQKMLLPITAKIEWMSVPAAEMTKHAINAFLATSIAFINELASICEQVGADVREVERGLKSDERIGPKSYLKAGGAFAGGTLARDIGFLNGIRKGCLLQAVRESNNEHKLWPQRKLTSVLGSLQGKNIALWGLTYKVGTDTLRRSSSVELGLWLKSQGANVRAHDPAIQQLPPYLEDKLSLCATPAATLAGAAALVVATAWPLYRELPLGELTRAMAEPVVIDMNGALSAGNLAGVKYFTVGQSPR